MSEILPSERRPHFTVTADGEIYGVDTPENREAARRIRACVNACEAISTEDLEAGIVQDMCRAIESLAPLLDETKGNIEQLIRQRNEAHSSSEQDAPNPTLGLGHHLGLRARQRQPGHTHQGG